MGLWCSDICWTWHQTHDEHWYDSYSSSLNKTFKSEVTRAYFKQCTVNSFLEGHLWDRQYVCLREISVSTTRSKVRQRPTLGVLFGKVSILSYVELLHYTNGPWLLCSSSQNFLAVPRTKLKTYGDRAFSTAAPRLWNQLPPELRSVTSVDQFRSQLKTYLFKLAYDVWF